jgi:hypothetical protein
VRYAAGAGRWARACAEGRFEACWVSWLALHWSWNALGRFGFNHRVAFLFVFQGSDEAALGGDNSSRRPAALIAWWFWLESVRSIVLRLTPALEALA